MGHAYSSHLSCSILGPLQVRVDNREAIIGAPKQRLLLAILLCRVNTVTSSAQLLDALWGEIPPRTARKNLQVYVSTLRKIVGDRIDFQGWGYRFHAERDELDLLRFQELARTGRSAIRSGALSVAAESLGTAVGMWHDQPLAEFAHVPAVAGEVKRFTELFLSVYEDWVELEIGLGRHVEALAGLDALAVRFPTRERITAARMTALARCGRVYEALSHFETLRQHLAVEVGIDPSPVLKELYQRILKGSDTPRRNGARGRGWGIGTDGTATPPAPARGLGPDMSTVIGPDMSAAPGGRRSIDTARPAHAPANQLPRDLADFVGREAEVRRIVDDPAPVTVITGELGIGKTALAVHVAHMLAPDFTDGALMVTLGRGDGPRRIEDVLRELMEAAGLNVAGVRDRDVLASLWRSWLANRKVLLILDDAPDEASARALLPGTTASKALATSRSRLSGLESVVRITLGELSANEGVAFLGRLIGDERVRGDLPAVSEIFARYGLSPLVLRLLGARIAGLPHLPLRRLADRLARAERVLDEFAAGDMLLRERFEGCYNRPSWPLRPAFLTLGGLAGPPFGHDELVEALHGVGRPAERVIESLIEANVLTVPDEEVTAHSMCYTMSPLAHRFAAELHGAGRV
ncbi:BTAD domain-containing putative transcriptional regulator [Sphaerimonospora sp. CA-214678]|uniref:AfsR/SARP family transcriptional regulator n=1 Tax=Sphaerimonospora sp. CA-214678 TaxID=3240029 RepID=UPI003D90E5C5